MKSLLSLGLGAALSLAMAGTAIAQNESTGPARYADKPHHAEHILNHDHDAGDESTTGTQSTSDRDLSENDAAENIDARDSERVRRLQRQNAMEGVSQNRPESYDLSEEHTTSNTQRMEEEANRNHDDHSRRHTRENEQRNRYTSDESYRNEGNSWMQGDDANRDARQQQDRMNSSDSWMSLRGTISEVNKDSFTLEVGDGEIEVVLNEWSGDTKPRQLETGQNVIVTAKVDEDLFEKQTLKASSVYVDDMNSYHYADDFHTDPYPVAHYEQPVNMQTYSLQGTVSDIQDDELILRVGSKEIRVETDSIDGRENLSETVSIGDRISVNGKMDYDFLEGTEFEAENLVVLSR